MSSIRLMAYFENNHLPHLPTTLNDAHAGDHSGVLRALFSSCVVSACGHGVYFENNTAEPSP